MPILSIEDDVKFYPACRNEVLDHDGVRWFQLEDYAFDVSDITRRRDEVLSVNREPWSATMKPFGRVASPGPGDDIGTLVIWADDVAYWRSDSGDLETWMVDDELDQQWVC